MRKKMLHCLLSMDEADRTRAACLERLKTIKDSLKRGAGVLKSISPEKMARNPRYWKSTLDGWADHLQTLGNELLLIQTELLKYDAE